jgi:thiol-disulfide isomerase/thioredoxin
MIMNDSTPDHRRARVQLGVCGAMLVAAVVVVFLAGRGVFRSMTTFPYIFGVVITISAVTTLFPARRTLTGVRIVVAATVVLAAISAPVVQMRAISRALEARDEQAMAVLGGTPAPPIPFVQALGVDGAPASPMWLRGRVTLVNFWATWCGPCVDEMPMLERFWQEQRGRGIVVIGVTGLYGDERDAGAVTQEIARIATFLEQHEVSYPVLVEFHDKPAHRAYRVPSLPTSVLIDADGVIVGHGAGVAGAERLMSQAVGLASTDD